MGSRGFELINSGLVDTIYECKMYLRKEKDVRRALTNVGENEDVFVSDLVKKKDLKNQL